jgi:hypothetical protein
MGVDRCGGIVDEGAQAEAYNNALAPFTLIILLPQMLQSSRNHFLKRQFLLMQLENNLEYLETIHFQISLIIQQHRVEAGPALGYLS